MRPPPAIMSSRDRIQAARGAMRPPSAPPTTGTKRKEREYEQETGDETNINVVVRCRGRSEREVRENSGVVLSTTGVKGKSVELSMGPNAISNKTYHFDKVFSPAADQAIIFEDVVSPILSEMLAGFNCTIFAYGQTGTGKTYTMSGDMTDTLGLLSDAAGIIPRVLYSLFQKLENDGVECSVKCSFIELYNEELRDLLAADDSVKLKLYDDSNKKSQSATVVHGMEESHIKSAAAGIKILQDGSHRRQVAATKCNDLSSRSHTVFTITTYIKKTGETGEDYICSGKLNLVDLAGSENIQRSGAENKRATEAGLINKSLLTLGRVINALVDKSSHIPYRESKLTRLLQDSLGGRTKTCIIATVSPARSNLEDTISTLDYAFRAKNIRNKPQVNSMVSKKTLLREFTSEIEKLKGELIATRQRNGVYLSNEQYEEITVESESRRILSEEQRARIETIESNLRNKVQELFNLTNTFTLLKKDNELTRATLESTKDVLEKTELVLANTRDNLRDETALRVAHQSTEARLQGIGTKLITTVGDTVRDLDRVHDKLRRRSDLHRQNQASWKNTTLQVQDVSETVESRIGLLKDQFALQLAGLTDHIESFITNEIQRVLQGKEATQAGSIALSTKTATIKQNSSAARDGMNEVLEEIKVLRESVKDKVKEGLHGLSEAAAKISGEVITELDHFHTQLHSSYSSLGKDFKHIFDELSRELTVQRAESDRLRAALQEANRKNLQASLAASMQLEKCLEAERKAAEDDRDQLMQQISSLISASQTKRDERFSKSIIDTKSDIVQAAEDLERADQAYGQGMDEWAVQDAGLLERVSKSKDVLKGKMKKDWMAIDTRNGAIQASTKAVHEETIKIVDAQLATIAIQMAALDEFVTRARQQNDNNHNDHIAHLEALSLHVRSTFGELETIFETDSAQAMNTAFQSKINLLTTALVPLDIDIRVPLKALSSHVTMTSLKEYVTTGETPQKKNWEYPTELPATIISTTPPSSSSTSLPAQTPSRNRSPQKSPRKPISPRKMASPRKTVKDVYVDSPVTIPPVPLERSESLKSLPEISTSLKEVDINTTNHTICLPVTQDDSIEKGSKEKYSGRMQQTRNGKGGKPNKVLSMSVGVGNEEKRETGKENFNPSKSTNAMQGGRRLRSSPLPIE